MHDYLNGEQSWQFDLEKSKTRDPSLGYGQEKGAPFTMFSSILKPTLDTICIANAAS